MGSSGKLCGLKSILNEFFARFLPFAVVCLITVGSLVSRHTTVKYVTLEYFVPLFLRQQKTQRRRLINIIVNRVFLLAANCIEKNRNA